MAKIADLIARVPIRVRLMLGFASVMVVLCGGFALLLHTLFSVSLDDAINRSLHARAADLTTLVRSSTSDRPETYPPLPESGGTFAQILGGGGQVIDATPEHRQRPLLAPAEVRRALRGGLLIGRRDNTRLLAQPLPSAPHTALVVGVSLSQRDSALRTLDDLLFLGGPVLLILTCLGGYALTASALGPVERMRARAAHISGAGRGERLPVPAARDELRRLGDTLNEMLSRLEEVLDRERAFVAHAGHELRTPLSVLKLELELTLSGDSSRAELEASLQSAQEEVERLARLAESLLVLARAERSGMPMEKRPVEVRSLMGTVVERIHRAARSQGRSVVLAPGERLTLSADPERLEQALTNMVANALVYGEGPVVLSAGERDGRVELHVVDEGEGFAPEFLPLAFENFARADRKEERPAGAGLGLSIVRAIAEAHGGRAEAANRAGGGADVWMSLPR